MLVVVLIFFRASFWNKNHMVLMGNVLVQYEARLSTHLEKQSIANIFPDHVDIEPFSKITSLASNIDGAFCPFKFFLLLTLKSSTCFVPYGPWLARP